ncbi:MAG: hypothetical protein ACFFD4_40705 [Candidatus Odinarchaeota archaeon]
MATAKQNTWRVYEDGTFRSYVFGDSALEVLQKYLEHQKLENGKECYSPTKIQIELFATADKFVL